MDARPAPVPDGAAALLALVSGLRAEGVDVPVSATVTCAAALGARPTVGTRRAYWIGRVTLCDRPEDLPVYDRVFARWAGSRAPGRPVPPPPDPTSMGRTAGEVASEDGPSDGAAIGRAGAPAGGWRARRFEAADDHELALLREAVLRLRVGVPHRVTRRRRPGAGHELDLERSLERAAATDAELLDLVTRRRGQRRRRLVLVLDVSASMATTARAMLWFAIAVTRGSEPGAVEVFAFSTALARLTDVLRTRDPDGALAAAAETLGPLGGGTRIGDCLDRLCREHGAGRTLRGSIVIVASDGLERGDPATVARATARLRRLAHRVVWVNPLVGDDGYQPVQRGMAAALPAVDVLLPGHDLASLEDLASVLDALGGPGDARGRHGVRRGS